MGGCIRCFPNVIRLYRDTADPFEELYVCTKCGKKLKFTYDITLGKSELVPVAELPTHPKGEVH